ncbi:hypothetical protein GDO81_028946 [Engystomops pustulosus]|uniref:Uncharacterized protein n=1 Tax=Engystomops pustulosus TaxID=76066 RepID=A0AAV6YX35_ENGPU|nr:hypothetical protein GDO81_028946 [Engystomops pustulosus]
MACAHPTPVMSSYSLPDMVDIGVCASGDSTRRKMDPFAECPVEVVPPDMYDSFRAKIAANLQWICAKAYGIGKISNFS